MFVIMTIDIIFGFSKHTEIHDDARKWIPVGKNLLHCTIYTCMYINQRGFVWRRVKSGFWKVCLKNVDILFAVLVCTSLAASIVITKMPCGLGFEISAVLRIHGGLGCGGMKGKASVKFSWLVAHVPLIRVFARAMQWGKSESVWAGCAWERQGSRDK